MTVRPAKTQISLGIRPVWSESSLSAWRNLGSLATHWAHSEDSDQTGRMPRLTWVFAGRTVTLLVLTWGGSYSLLQSLMFTIFHFTKYHKILNNLLFNKRLAQLQFRSDDIDKILILEDFLFMLFLFLGHCDLNWRRLRCLRLAEQRTHFVGPHVSCLAAGTTFHLELKQKVWEFLSHRKLK